ncbi:DUF3566 domain-containing protein [Haloactinopolyspora sp.]|uniref:DUF3566 domain-containing protein n=1 Tax=Haloactinopolyspora sp. TaxID=1966353 RepID=UPI00262B7633|nr:DUF3566 domain-containing protein [Haloactinopolyspora sp.]
MNVPPPGPGTNDSSSGRGAKTSGPIATEMVAALRAQDAAGSDGGKGKGTNTPNGRPPAPQSSNGGSGGQGESQQRPSPPDPAVNTRRQANSPNEGDQQPRGAAAARVATKNNRNRQDTTPRNDDDTTPNPWSKQAQGDNSSRAQGAGNAAGSSAGSAQGAQGAQAERTPSQQAQTQRPTAPVPPPSLVAKQRREAAASGAAAPPLTAPSAPPAPAPSAAPSSGAASSQATADTQASIDAVPFESPKAKAKPARPAATRRGGRIRKARLRLMRVDPWSVMKTAFLLSVALGITLFVAVAVLWSVLDAAGVFSSVDEIVTDMTASDTNAGIDINQYVELSRVLGFTTLIAVVDVVLLTALATLGAFLYNLSASLLGGLELTLAEDD